MKVGIISYSLTGNNETLANGLASIYKAEHIRISEAKWRSMGKTVTDLLFNRVPPIHFHFTEAAAYDLILFVGPVWGGKAATPFRACFKQLIPRIENYAFVSISGGALGANAKLQDDLEKRLKKSPVAVIDLHITDLLPENPKPRAADTSAYRITKDDARKLTDTVVTKLRPIFG
jgi:hypothetical protein